MKNYYIANTALGIGREGLMAQLAIADKNAEKTKLLIFCHCVAVKLMGSVAI